MAIIDHTTRAGARGDHIGFLVDITRMLDRSDDVQDAVGDIGRALVATCADVVVVALIGDDGELHPMVVEHADPALEARADLLRELLRPVPDGIVESALLGQPALVEDVDLHAAHTELDHATRRCLLELDVVSAVACPVQVREEAFGVLLAATTAASSRRLAPVDRDLLGEVASRIGRALENDRLFTTLRAAEDRFVSAFEFAPIGMALLAEDDRGTLRCSDVNPALCRILDRHADELIGRPGSAFVHPDEAHLPAPDGSVERRFVRPDGTVRHCRVQAARLHEGKGIVCQILDVTDHRRDQDELARLVTHDRLTGLLNRDGFERAVADVLDDDRHVGAGAVLVLDLDTFSHFNDAHGSAAGDLLLRLVARTLTGRLRATDAAGRLGDDEFGVLLTNTTAAAAGDVAAELMRSVRSIALPVAGDVIHPTVSAGIRTFDRGRPGSAGELIADADAAVLEAKDQGRDRICVASLQTAVGRSCRHWSQRIRQALADDRLVLHEQPIMAVGTREIVRSELLVRMLDEDGCVIEPGVFLPAAERYGQVQDLDRWVVEQALDLLVRRRAHGVELPVNANLSGESLSDPEAIDSIIAGIREAGIDPRRLTFEITETAAVRDIERAGRLAARLSAIGCPVSLDDFGTGFSSFAYLKHLPVDGVKIDGQFIRDLARDHVDRLTVQAIVDVSRGAGATTTAEYVEDEVTLELLDHLGVDFAQGFHVGHPRPAAVRPDWCAR